MKKLQIVFFSIFAILANVYTIASIIKSGEFYGWHIGFIAISAIAIALVKLSVNELKVK